MNIINLLWTDNEFFCIRVIKWFECCPFGKNRFFMVCRNSSLTFRRIQWLCKAKINLSLSFTLETARNLLFDKYTKQFCLFFIEKSKKHMNNSICVNDYLRTKSIDQLRSFSHNQSNLTEIFHNQCRIRRYIIQLFHMDV